MKCFRCGNKLTICHEKTYHDYPMECDYCDENMFIMEGVEEYKNESSDLYRYINMIKNIVGSGLNNFMVLLWI